MTCRKFLKRFRLSNDNNERGKMTSLVAKTSIYPINYPDSLHKDFSQTENEKEKENQWHKNNKSLLTFPTNNLATKIH